MPLTDYAQFQITAKALIRRDDTILRLVSPDGEIDFPGGRVDQTEVGLPFESVLLREIEEECGTLLKIEVGNLAFATRRSYESGGTLHRVVGLFYDVRYVEGEVSLSEEHADCAWVAPSELADLKDRFAAGDEYEQFKKYFNF